MLRKAWPPGRQIDFRTRRARSSGRAQISSNDLPAIFVKPLAPSRRTRPSPPAASTTPPTTSRMQPRKYGTETFGTSWTTRQSSRSASPPHSSAYRSSRALRRYGSSKRPEAGPHLHLAAIRLRQATRHEHSERLQDGSKRSSGHFRLARRCSLAVRQVVSERD